MNDACLYDMRTTHAERARSARRKIGDFVTVFRKIWFEIYPKKKKHLSRGYVNAGIYMLDNSILKIEKNEFDIFDKDGKKIQIMYETNKSKKLIPKIVHYDDDNVDGIKYFIRYILGSKLKINEYFRLNKFINDNPTMSLNSSILDNFKKNFNIIEYDYERILNYKFDESNFLNDIKNLFNLNEDIINNESFTKLILDFKNIFFQLGGFKKNKNLFRINYSKNKIIHKIKYNK